MTINETAAKSILRKQKKIDSWFISRYSMNLYRGCQHNCVYCDGRAEKYQVEGEFGKEISVKTNAIELLEKELDPTRKRKPFIPGFFMLGGGVGDSYQPAEQKYNLTRAALQLLRSKQLPVHLLTKSTLIERDLDIIDEINTQTRAIVSFSFSSTDSSTSKYFEPGASEPAKRLKTIEKFKKKGIPTGAYLLPVIPFITDTPEILDRSFKDLKNAGADYVIFGGMTLKQGRQEDYFYNTLSRYYPDLLPEYRIIYTGKKWGQPADEYYKHLNNLYINLIRPHKIPKRIPPRIFQDILPENDYLIVILEQLDSLARMYGKKSPYGYAAHSIAKLEKPVSSMKDQLRKLNGVGSFTESIILEILNTGTSRYYETLLTR